MDLSHFSKQAMRFAWPGEALMFVKYRSKQALCAFVLLLTVCGLSLVACGTGTTSSLGGGTIPTESFQTSTVTATPIIPSAFKVTSIELSASPSLNGHACGTQFTETYTAIFHIAPNGPGGTIIFNYTINNGRSQSQNINLSVNASQTSTTYTFTWSGTLPADHTAPGVGIVLMSAPNQGESPGAVPNGSCS